MKKLIIVLLPFFFLTCCSCEKEPLVIENEEGVIIKKPYKWKTDISDGGLVNGRATHLLYNDGVLTFGNKAGKSILYFLNINNGSIKWEWDDFYNANEIWSLRYPYINNNYSLFIHGKKLYSIDLINGSTFWKRELPTYPLGRVDGIGNTYYTLAESLESTADTIYESLFQGDIMNENYYSEILTPNYDRTTISPFNKIGILTTLLPYINEQSDTMLIVVTKETVDEDWNSVAKYGLYNKSKEEWIYENIELSEEPSQSNGTGGYPLKYNGKVYFEMGKYVVCCDLATGEVLWRKKFIWGFGFSGILLVEEMNVILANDEEGIMFCLDAETGNTLWQTESGGTTSRLHYQDGVVYYAGGSADLEAIDVATGELLWEIESPDSENFRREISGIPSQNGEKGKIFASTYLNMYCFDAVH